MDNSENKPQPNLFQLFFGGSDAGAEVQQRINDLVPSIIYIYDAGQKKISYINKKVTDILGYDVSDTNSWDEHLSNVVYKDDAELVKKEIENFYNLKGNETRTYNSRLNHKQGNWRYFRTTGSVIKRNDKGEAAAFLFIAEDITQDIESEEEINAKKALIKETEELLQFGTWVWDMNTDKMQCSDGILNLYAYTREELQDVTGAFFMAQLPSSDSSILNEKINTAVETDTSYEHIYKITTKGNQQKIVSTKGRPVKSPDGKLLKLVGTTRDVTEQINAYKELYHYKQMTLEKEEFLESGSWEYEVKSKKLIWSEGMYKLFDFVRNDSLVKTGEDFYFLNLLPPVDGVTEEDWQKAIAEKDNYVRNAIIGISGNKTRQLETYGKIIRDDEGIAIKIMGTTKDVTQLKEYERQLEKKLLDLERSNKELEEFAYVASHDLQEPLRKISTFGERISVKFEDKLGDEGKTYLTKMLSATANMRYLIDTLLEFSRLGHRGIKYESANLNILLAEVQSEIELEIEETGATIITDTLPVVDGIHTQIKQLFSNIILNAIKFRKPDVRPLIIISSQKATPEDKLKYGLQQDVDFYEIKITDNGIGFEQEYSEKIFQLFQRLHAKSEYGGAGIGLSICRKIMENHHGRMFAESTLGEGAVFLLLLPEKNN